ncbi:uncharacterized protein LOC128204569 [Mya arenaria]|uniref:uncharacterized protein LOC128204569 n=1 Tax=Mya arenaria TaxID=6604 RepID=UPI0022E87404|nr:uncharacterized protein LOC128204569 [Mya arenaria]
MQLNHEKKSDKELQDTESKKGLTKKNRKYADIPGDTNRPRLYLCSKTCDSDNINAIYINSLKTKRRILVAQTPLPDTAADFIALAVQENCSCIVSIEAHLEKRKGIGFYFSGDDQTIEMGMVTVENPRDLFGKVTLNLVFGSV